MRATRRAFLAALSYSALDAEVEKGKNFPPEWKRYPDPATEFDVYRLTDPAYSSRLPASYNHVVSRRHGFLIFTSDRAGSDQVLRMDLKTGELRQLTQAKELDPASVTLTPDERGFCFFDGPSLRMSILATLRDREIYRVPDGWTRGEGASLTGDGISALFFETRGSSARLRRISTARGAATTMVETPFAGSHPLARPRRAQALYRQSSDALWLVNFDGQQNRKLRTAADGKIASAIWAPNGRTILYLHVPDDKTKLAAIREHTPDENLDKQIATTSQFAAFQSNSDSSVFVGASRNRNSPDILILLRVT